MDRTARRAWVMILVALILGSGMAWAGGGGSITVGGWPVYPLAVAACFLIQWLVYLPSQLRRTERFFDATGAITYVTITAGLLALHPKAALYHLLLAAAVVLWALRLGTFLFLRVSRDGGDGRFDEIKPSVPRFLAVWTVQGLWITLTAAAAWMALSSTRPQTVTLPVLAGLLIWAVGLSIEVVADLQKSRFRADPANRGRFITTGLWSLSRHPNYLGEIALWTGVAIMALPALHGWQLMSLVSPVFVWLLLTKVSGIPLLERRADDRWGGQEDYERYKRTTPVLLPRWGAR